MLVEFALAAVLSGGPKPAPCSEIPWRRGVEQRVEMLRCLSSGPFRKVSFRTSYQVALCESGPNLDPRAEYKGSMGLFQHNGWDLWRARALKYLSNPRWGLNPRRVSPYNAYANAVVTFSMVSDDDIGWEPWSCYR